MAEWIKALVLKTSKVNSLHGFESHSDRVCFFSVYVIIINKVQIMFTVPNTIIKTDNNSVYCDSNYETWSHNINISIITEIIKNIIILLIITIMNYRSISGRNIKLAMSGIIFLSFIFSLLFAHYYSKYYKLFIIICGFSIIICVYPLFINENNKTQMLHFLYFFVIMNIYLLLIVLFNKKTIYYNEIIINDNTMLTKEIIYAIVIIISLVITIYDQKQIIINIVSFILIILLIISIMIMVITQYYLDTLCDLICLFILFIYLNHKNQSILPYLLIVIILCIIKIIYHYIENYNKNSDNLTEPNIINEYVPEFIQDLYSSTVNIINEAKNTNNKNGLQDT